MPVATAMCNLLFTFCFCNRPIFFIIKLINMSDELQCNMLLFKRYKHYIKTNSLEYSSVIIAKL